ncbi:MAG: Preprotein translocase subunit SecY [Methanophagales archaeon]|nr:Preprotein translocase subunit SecY [Methanophagales archaeon]
MRAMPPEGAEALRFRDLISPVLSRFPMVERPAYHVHFKKKLAWTLGVLVLYFALCNIPLFGLGPESMDMFGRWRAIFAGERFSLTALGIMPIVDASIVLQLLVGAKIIELDLTTEEDRAFYQNLQKLLVLLFSALISLSYVVGFYQPDPAVASKLGVSPQFISFLLFLQVFAGGMLIYFLDEVVSKWGIGSGVSLFILAGVSQAIVTGLVNPEMEESYGGYHWAIGVIPRLFQIFFMPESVGLTGGEMLTLEFLFESGIIALLTTIAVFLAVVYLESTRIEIPLAHSLARGARGRFPIKLLYASVLPVILVRALQMSIQGIGKMLYARGITILGTYDEWGNAESGIMYFLQPIYSPHDWIPALVATPHEAWEIALRICVDLFFMVVLGVVFALFWINTTGMGAKDVAEQIHRSGLQIPGFRRTPATLERMLENYIPKITVMGAAILGALCVLANMLGTVGNATGTGLLLAVSIAYSLYQQIASEQVMEMYPALRRFLGSGA